MKFQIVMLIAGVMLAPDIVYAAGSSSTTTTTSVSSDLPKAKNLVERKNYTAAIPLLRRVVKSQPKNADAWNLLAFSNRKLQKFDLALNQYKKALKIQPTHKGANEYLGELYLSIGDLPKAKDRLEVLNRMCIGGFVGCEEYNELKEKVTVYIEANGS